MDSVSISAAKSLVCVQAPSTAILEIVRMSISTRAIVSESSVAQIIRGTDSGTGTANTPTLRAAYAASGATAKTNLTVEPAGAAVHQSEPFNFVSGWQWVALDEEGRIVVPPSASIAIKINDTPGAATVMSALIEYIEKG
jgi:hypothetical protein